MLKLMNHRSLANLQDPSLDARRVDCLIGLDVGKGTVTLHQNKDFICTKLENPQVLFVNCNFLAQIFPFLVP